MAPLVVQMLQVVPDAPAIRDSCARAKSFQAIQNLCKDFGEYGFLSPMGPADLPARPNKRDVSSCPNNANECETEGPWACEAKANARRSNMAARNNNKNRRL